MTDETSPPDGSGPGRPRLWFTPDRQRFFLVPDGVERPQGAVEVRNLTGGTDQISAEALEAWEVSRSAAAQHVDAGWVDAVAEVRDTWRRIVGAPPGEGKPDLSAFLGVSPGEAILDREKRREGRRSLVDRVGRLLQPRKWDDDRLERTEASLDRFTDQLRGAGRALAGEADKLAEVLDDARPDVERAVRRASESLSGRGGSEAEE